MNPLRHFFLVLALVFAQLAAAAHGVDHGLGDDDGLPGHACALCLAAHDLGATLPALAALPPPVAKPVTPALAAAAERGQRAAPAPRQGAPPYA